VLSRDKEASLAGQDFDLEDGVVECIYCIYVALVLLMGRYFFFDM